MFHKRPKFVIFICFIIITVHHFTRAQPTRKKSPRNYLKGSDQNTFFGKMHLKLPPLCNLKTNELIAHYGYSPEKHTVTTQDGYILSVFRCNSKKPSSDQRKAVILQHGIFSSSDEFVANIPEQAMAFVFADAGYDVWLPNSRGTTYSRNHTFKSPNRENFWDFSFSEIGLYDLPAIIDYVREQTSHTEVYFVGHSQGTTALMVLLSEKPEYNKYIAAASLMAPVAYLGNSGSALQFLAQFHQILQFFPKELLPKQLLSHIFGIFCSLDTFDLCGAIINAIFGPSDHQRNKQMMPSIICHSPNGASVKQLMHYAQEIKYKFFGKFMKGSKIPRNFDLSRITTPITLHYSPTDRFTNPKDVKRLISELNHVVYVQVMNDKDFNHMDFMWSINSASKVYSKILNFFQLYP